MKFIDFYRFYLTEELINLFSTIAIEEFDLDIKNSNLYVKIEPQINSPIAVFKIDMTKKKYLEGFIFSESLMLSDKEIIFEIMRHELVHWKIMNGLEVNTKGFYNMLFPHGYFFIREAKTRKIEYKRYIKKLGLEQNMLINITAIIKFFKKLKIEENT